MSLSYEKTGVSLKAADLWVDRIKSLIKNRGDMVKHSDVRSQIGGFSGLYKLPGGLLLAACCDGVGTKLEIAKKAKIYRGLGQDLVAMNVNDLITCGAAPLFFLDYAAVGQLDIEVMSEILEGVLDGCEMSGCALLGGETAEMPGVYDTDSFDLAGFSVGILKEEDLIDCSLVSADDVLIGLPSSGLHSNGYSLARQALRTALDAPEEQFIRALLRPTKIYVKPIAAVTSQVKVHAMAHITGGGLEDNIARVIPQGLTAAIDYNSWQRPAIFEMLASGGDEKIAEDEMRRVFNLGIGYVIVAAAEDERRITDILKANGEDALTIGHVVSC